MKNQSFYAYLLSVLKKDSRFIDKEENLIRNAVIDSALKYDENLFVSLLKDKKLKAEFFQEIAGSTVFLQSRFIDYIQDKNFLIDSYTKYKNKIGLTIDEKYLNERGEVALVWPFKDCVLEGGQTKEEQKRQEIFFNEVLAKDEIDRLFEPKVLTNFKRYTNKGEETVGEIRVDENSTLRENMIIKGNNFLTLHSLKTHFAGKVKLIYIDPPFNTRSDANTFAYNNTFNHSSWLTFMKNRLQIAKELLREDGMMIIDIDHYELFYLGVLADEIFGYENRIGLLAVIHNLKGRFNEFFANAHENKIVYAKNQSKVKVNNLRNDRIDDYKFEDKKSKYKILALQRTGDGSKREDRPNLFYPIYINDNLELSIKERPGWIEIWPIDEEGIERRWRWSKDKVEQDWQSEIEIKKVKDRYKIYTKIRYMGNGEKPKSIWFKPEYSGTTGTNDLKSILGDKLFTYPKSVELVKDTLIMGMDKDDIVLDFFAGSGTTAHAVLELNKEDGGQRRFILCEQMDYVNTVTTERVRKVISAHGEGSFIYAELMKYNEGFIGRIQDAKSTKELRNIWEDMKVKGMVDWRLDWKKFDAAIEEFKAMSLDQQKRALVELLDKNALYVPIGDIDDADFKVSAEDKRLNKQFYG